jgi:hypothetical protein
MGLVTAAIVLAVAVTALAQRRLFDEFGYGRAPAIHNIPYDGQFTFVRVKYDTAPGGYWAGGRPSWVHGYPLAEENLMRIMDDISYLGARTDDINVLSLDDPELCKYPIAYIIEVGWWTLTDREAAALRAYIQKGGFVIVDDFKMLGWRGIDSAGWEPFETNMKRDLPEAKKGDMELEHQSSTPSSRSTRWTIFLRRNTRRPVFKGVYEDNDPSKRLVMIVNYNTDISQFWEWSGRGLRPVDDTNEAYKLGVNYLFYGMTH